MTHSDYTDQDGDPFYNILHDAEMSFMCYACIAETFPMTRSNAASCTNAKLRVSLQLGLLVYRSAYQGPMCCQSGTEKTA